MNLGILLYLFSQAEQVKGLSVGVVETSTGIIRDVTESELLVTFSVVHLEEPETDHALRALMLEHVVLDGFIELRDGKTIKIGDDFLFRHDTPPPGKRITAESRPSLRFPERVKGSLPHPWPIGVY